MINLRYHVVSITAVFLALALGLTLGSTFLERATVDSLNGQLGSLEDDLNANSDKIDALETELAGQQASTELFAEQGIGPLLEGHLDGVPVIVLVASGTDGAIVDQSLAVLSVAGADVRGAWFATDRFALDDDAERRDLGSLLGIETDFEASLRRTIALRLGVVLGGRLEPVTAPDSPDTPESPTTDPNTADPTTTETTAAPIDDDAVGDAAEPALIADLVTAGFLEFRPLGDGGGDPTLPAAGARLVVIADSKSDLTLDQLFLPLLENLATAGPVSAVFATGLSEGEDPAARGAVVDLVRNDERLTAKLSTVDDLDVFEGWAALVLAVEKVSGGRIAHYGRADSASRLLPASDGPT